MSEFSGRPEEADPPGETTHPSGRDGTESPGEGGTDPPRRIDRSSPWPVLIALGLVVAEVGILFGVALVGIGGLLLFGWSCAALLSDAGVTASGWRAVLATGTVLATAGGIVWAARLPAYTVSAAVRAVAVDPLAFRGAMVCAAAGILVVVGLAGAVRSTGGSDWGG